MLKQAVGLQKEEEEEKVGYFPSLRMCVFRGGGGGGGGGIWFETTK